MLASTKNWLCALGGTLVALALALPAQAQPATGASAFVDKYLPADAEFVAAVNVHQLLNSALVKKYSLEELKKKVQDNPQAQQIIKATGIDPFNDITTLMLAGSGSGRPASEKVRFVVQGNFDIDKIQAAAEAFAKQHPDALKIETQGSVRIYQLQQPKMEGKAEQKPVYVAFVDKHTLVGTPTREYTVQTVQEAGKEPTGTPNKDLAAARAQFTGQESLWIAGLITEEMRNATKKNPQMAGLIGKLEYFAASVNLTEAVDVRVILHATDAAGATQVRKTINQFKPILAVLAQSNEDLAPIVNEILNATKVIAKGNDVVVSLTITEELIEKAKKKE